MKSKVLIFEDEWNSIKGSFELANIFAFDNKLTFEPKSRSQDVAFESWRETYGAVFIDITLAKNSEWDGFNILKRITDLDLYPLSKIIVLSGNNKVEEKLIQMDIEINELKVLYKPINFEVLSRELHVVLNRN
jgi:DNA-binding response OmpR family regulator